MQKALYDAVAIYAHYMMLWIYMLIASLSWTESLQQTSDFRNHLLLEIFSKNSFYFHRILVLMHKAKILCSIISFYSQYPNMYPC